LASYLSDATLAVCVTSQHYKRRDKGEASTKMHIGKQMS
jgi:hypothetical protein